MTHEFQEIVNGEAVASSGADAYAINISTETIHHAVTDANGLADWGQLTYQQEYRIYAEKDGLTTQVRILTETNVPPSGPPVTPTGLQPTPGNGDVALFANTVANADGYRFYRHTSDSFASASQVGTDQATPAYTDTSVTNGTQYYYWITAFNADGESDPSASVSATPTASVQFEDAFDGATGVAPAGYSQPWEQADFTLDAGGFLRRDTVGEPNKRSPLIRDGVSINASMTTDILCISRVVDEGTTGFRLGEVILGVNGTYENGNALIVGPIQQGEKRRLSLHGYSDGASIGDQATAEYAFPNGQWNCIRVRYEDGNLKARIWPEGQSEPSSWMIDHEIALPTGGVGVFSFTGDTIADWKWLALRTDGSSAPLPS